MSIRGGVNLWELQACPLIKRAWKDLPNCTNKITDEKAILKYRKYCSRGQTILVEFDVWHF